MGMLLAILSKAMAVPPGEIVMSAIVLASCVAWFQMRQFRCHHSIFIGTVTMGLVFLAHGKQQPPSVMNYVTDAPSSLILPDFSPLLSQILALNFSFKGILNFPYWVWANKALHRECFQFSPIPFSCCLDGLRLLQNKVKVIE